MASLNERCTTLCACALTLAVATACADAGPVWVDLAEGFRPALSSAESADVSDEVTCDNCGGAEERLCQVCLGTSKAACTKCRGFGSIQDVLGLNTKKCDACKRRGYLRCESCKGGYAPCGVCEGKHVDVELPACGDGARTALCRGCWDGSELAWVVAAEHLAEAGRGSEALAHFDVAVRRARTRYERLEEEFPWDADQRKVLRKEYDRRVATLERRRRLLADEH